MDTDNLTSGQKGSFTKLKNQIKEESRSLLDDIHKKKHEIDELRTYLLEDDEDGSCLKSQADEAFEEISEHLKNVERLSSSIEGAYNNIFEKPDGVYEGINSIAEDLKEIQEETSEIRRRFSESYKKLYGDEESDTGLEAKLVELFNTYEENLGTHRSKSDELILQIEGALSGATNLELAKAFQDQKKSYSWPKNGWAFLFIASISAMVLFSLDINELKSDAEGYGLELLKRLPVFGPLVWLALFASKQQGQNKRLEQEYAHKEAITKTYVGHKRQIDKLADGDDKDALVRKLAASTIDAIEFNPSSTLDNGSHKDDLPSAELLKIIKSSIDKIGAK